MQSKIRNVEFSVFSISLRADTQNNPGVASRLPLDYFFAMLTIEGNIFAR